MSYTLIEPCCGTAALTLAALGARRSLMPYQGSKWRHRAALSRVAASMGYTGAPARVELSDPGPWGTAMGHVLSTRARAAVLTLLRRMAARDPREVFDELQAHPAPDGPAFTAQFLFLQRLAYSGKAVGMRDRRWISPGFNATSAYGVAATERFGAVKPMIPSLIRTLESYAELSPAEVVGDRCRAYCPDWTVQGRTLVYIDPPYFGVTPYPDGQMSRQEVIDLARAWKASGAAVMVSEAIAIPELIAEGWKAVALAESRADTSRFRGQQDEWITASE